MKKLISLILVMAIVFAMSATVFASKYAEPDSADKARKNIGYLINDITAENITWGDRLDFFTELIHNLLYLITDSLKNLNFGGNNA